jgi:hypothetical protein
MGSSEQLEGENIIHDQKIEWGSSKKSSQQESGEMCKNNGIGNKPREDGIHV